MFLQGRGKVSVSAISEGLKKKKIVEHSIELKPNAKPIKQRYFPTSPAIEQLIHKEIDEMLEFGLIAEAPNS